MVIAHPWESSLTYVSTSTSFCVELFGGIVASERWIALFLMEEPFGCWDYEDHLQNGSVYRLIRHHDPRRTRSKKKREGSTQDITEFSRDRNSVWWRMQDWQDSSLRDKDRASVCIPDQSAKTVIVGWQRQLHSEKFVLHVPHPGSSSSLNVWLVLPKLRNWFDRYPGGKIRHRIWLYRVIYDP